MHPIVFLNKYVFLHITNPSRYAPNVPRRVLELRLSERQRLGCLGFFETFLPCKKADECCDLLQQVQRLHVLFVADSYSVVTTGLQRTARNILKILILPSNQEAASI